MKIFQSSPATEWRTKVAHGETVGFDPKINKAPDGAKEMVRGLIFCRPCRGLFRSVVLPTVSPWATFFRASGAAATQLAAAAIILFAAFGARAETTNDLSDAEIQGRQLVQKILIQQPTDNFTNSGILYVTKSKMPRRISMLKCKVIVSPTKWTTTYEDNEIILGGAETNSWLYIENFQNTSGQIYLARIVSKRGGLQSPDTMPVTNFDGLLSDQQLPTPFANSDFWIGDLGLEFFHWPEQKILKRENSRGRICKVLESTNPNPSTNGYSRVVSWIDEESGGIVHAEAFDAQNKLLKEFDPKSFKKVNGQWELQEMQIRNVQTASRSRIEFDLKN